MKSSKIFQESKNLKREEFYFLAILYWKIFETFQNNMQNLVLKVMGQNRPSSIPLDISVVAVGVPSIRNYEARIPHRAPIFFFSSKRELVLASSPET